MNWKKIPLPERLKTLPKDQRGYPIPFVVFIDKFGKPNFQIDAAEKVNKCMEDRRCAVCGHQLGNDCWLVGTYNRAFRSPGFYQDAAVHKECGTYALQVCPFLAAPSYTKMLTTDKIPDEYRPYVDVSVPKNSSRLAEFFVFAKVVRYHVLYAERKWLLMPQRPFSEVEYWRHGNRISEPEARSFLV